MVRNNKSNYIKEAIVETVAFFDLFDYPLTIFEIWRYLSVAVALGDLAEAMGSITGPILAEKNGFYFLAGRKEVLSIRQDRYRSAAGKIKRVRRLSALFRLVPWVRFVAIGNNIGANNLKEASDIDLFIVTRPKRLWLTRLMCAGMVAALNLRPKPGRVKNKFCLSFYADEDSLDLAPWRLKDNDIYFTYWLAGLVPVFDRDGVYSRLLEANRWLGSELPNWQAYQPAARQVISNPSSYWYEAIVDLFFGGLEQIAKRLELRIMPPELNSIANRDTRVIINDRVLRLYANDRREQYRKEWRQKLSELGVFSSGNDPAAGAEKSRSDDSVTFCFIKYEGHILIFRRNGLWQIPAFFFPKKNLIESFARLEIRLSIGPVDGHIGGFKVGPPRIIHFSPGKKSWKIYPLTINFHTQPPIRLNQEYHEYKWIEPRQLTVFQVIKNSIYHLGEEQGLIDKAL